MNDNGPPKQHSQVLKSLKRIYSI